MVEHVFTGYWEFVFILVIEMRRPNENGKLGKIEGKMSNDFFRKKLFIIDSRLYKSQVSFT